MKSEEFDKAAEDLRLATRHLGMIVGQVRCRRNFR